MKAIIPAAGIGTRLPPPGTAAGR